MWPSSMTRPDISSVVRAVAKFCENPGMAHWKPVVKILKYMRRTPEKGITYGRDGNGRRVVRAFVDSDHATCLDTRRSTLAGTIIFCGGAITWFSRTQATTAEGTSEVEYVAMSEVVKEILFLRQVQAFIIFSLESN